MKIHGRHYRTIWLAEDGWSVKIIDQTKLPHSFETAQLTTAGQCAHAIKSMQVRGAPLIGATAAYGVCLALRQDASDRSIDEVIAYLENQRPTAINLKWALQQMRNAVKDLPPGERVEAAYQQAKKIADDDVETNRRIGVHGAAIIRQMAADKKDAPLNILTHCNAGWLATVDWGTALSPVYQAHDANIPIHVWVDETRPRNQGSALTAYELSAHGVPCTIITDNAGGHLMQTGQVDLCIVGTDRTARNGDVANKIGTYLKALAAHHNNIPFYVALPHSTIDWSINKGSDIPIEERDSDEVLKISGRTASGSVVSVEIAAPQSQAANFAFDVTPAALVTGLLTERGLCPASVQGLKDLYPERQQ